MSGPFSAHELSAIARGVNEMRNALEECRDYLEDRADNSIEPNGKHRPNEEMRLLQIVKDALGEGW